MAASATIAVMTIRRYENRMMQIKLGTLNSLILMCVMISVVVFYINATEKFGESLSGFRPVWLPFVGVACNWLALRFIRRDEKKVRDADRIR
jgi:F0F1-type ATP synthase assembly protein I